MTLRLADGRTTFLDFREKAPLAATADMFLDAHGQRGQGPLDRLPGWPSACPARPPGSRRRGREYGTLSRAAVLAPAIRLARDGFVLGPGDVACSAQGTDDFRRDPAAAAIFLAQRPPLAPGDRLVQPRPRRAR